MDFAYFRLIIITMRNFLSVILAATFISSTTFSAPASPDKTSSSFCPATIEFVTTLEFLRNQKDKLASDQESRKIATQVSEGCEGAAKRFIRTVQLLVKAGAIPPKALELGVEFAGRNDVQTEAFAFVFKRAFLKEYIDLDLNSAIQMARTLSIDFNGDPRIAKQDFEKITDFCTSKKELDLPLPLCGNLAARVAKSGVKYKNGAAQPFLKTFEFSTSKAGPHLITSASLNIAEEIIEIGEGASESFIQAFRYAVSKSGLNLDISASLDFAKTMAKKSVQKKL